MISIDTNVVLRVILRDDAEQHGVATRELAKAGRAGADILVNDIVLVETIWTLVRTYRIDKPVVIGALQAFMQTSGIRFESDANVALALELFEHSTAGFADCLTVAKNTAFGCTSTLTFDEGMRKLPGVKLLTTP
ncbi:MAG: type II toxin-antitoxin system VapC family toxin [Rhizobiales bacterium]|nr:type II toxin-antitoxin system VapC family toxin [Rhizobacter sp.]